MRLSNIVLPNKNIFCNSPWYELHIYWDGSLGFCCQESHKLYPDSESSKYNLKNISIYDWHNSQVMKNIRLDMFKETPNSICSRCNYEEQYSATSRRHRALQKSIIFVRSNFDESYDQSPHYDKFNFSANNDGLTSCQPVDLHIDLGNYCNLACKMCSPKASSTIAVQEVKWGNNYAKPFVGTDWTADEKVWSRTIADIATIKNLKNVHFMGGETLITKKFEEFVDFMIDKNQTDFGISFVTNGTTFNESLLNKLKKFKRVGIEISIETITAHNSYVRQGTDTEAVLKTINRYQSYCNNSSITITIRPAISLLTIGYYHTLLKYCLDKKFLVKSLFVTKPSFLNVQMLPKSVRLDYVANYKNLIKEYQLENIVTTCDYNESDPNQYLKVVKTQVDQCLTVLEQPTIDNPEQWQELVNHCKKWDTVYNHNALDLYPELSEYFIKYGY